MTREERIAQLVRDAPPLNHDQQRAIALLMGPVRRAVSKQLATPLRNAA